MKRNNLPIDKNYTLIDSYYTGGLENGGMCCDNCNRMITNIAVIKDNNNNSFNVGLDCAEALTNVNGLHNAVMEFKEMKAIRAKLNKAKKSSLEIDYFIDNYGNLRIMSSIFNISKDIDFSKKYLNDCLLLVSNPSKIGYKKFELKNFIVPFDNCAPKDFYKQKHILNVNDFKIIIEGTTCEKNNFYFEISVYKDNNLIDDRRFYMYNDISRTIQYIINKYLFDNL